MCWSWVWKNLFSRCLFWSSYSLYSVSPSNFPMELFIFSPFPPIPTQSFGHSILAFVIFSRWKTSCWDHQEHLVSKSCGNFHSSLQLDHLAVMDTWPFSSWSTLFWVLLRQKIFLGFSLSLSLQSLLLLKICSSRTQSIFFLGILIHFTCLVLITTCMNWDGLGYNPKRQPQISMD